MFKIRTFRRHAPDDAAGAGAGTPVLDADAQARLHQLDPDGRRGFVVQVMQTYLTSLQRHLATLAQARERGDVRAAGEVAHTLKSSSASVGALVFAERCAVVERLARASDAAALGAPLAELCAEGERVGAAVRAMLPP